MSEKTVTTEEEQNFTIPAYTPELREELVNISDGKTREQLIYDQIQAGKKMAQALHIYLNAGHKEAREEASIVAKKSLRAWYDAGGDI